MGSDASPAIGRPLSIRGVTLRNRVVGAPMERNYCDLAGRATPRYAAYLGARAAGGAALIFTEASYIRQDSKARLHQAGMHHDDVLPGLRAIADEVHAHGALLGVELNHAGRVVPSAVSERPPIAPSAVACAEIGGEVPRALDADGIDDVVAAFAAAAGRSVRGGADVISVHGAHGYLIGQFVSPRSNRRTDEYASHSAFLNEVLTAVRDAIGPEMPLFLRWSAFEGLPGGLDEEGALRALLEARLDLVDVVDLSAGTYGAGHWITPSGEVAEGYLGGLARTYRAETGLIVSVAGRIASPVTAARLIAEEQSDLVSVARALHADPDWAKHAVAGTTPRPCISANQGCADVIFSGKPLWCTANPHTGREGHTAPAQTTVSAEAQVLVAGSGPAGLQAALTLAGTGLRVVIHEAEARLGGQLAVMAELRAKPQHGRLLEWYLDQLQHLGVQLHTEMAVDLTTSPLDTAAVVDATGGLDYLPPTKGPGSHRVTGLRRWWVRGRTAGNPSAVTIWGADRCGVYAADHLAGEGVEVTIVASQDQLAPDGGARERLHAVERLSSQPSVRLVLGATLDQVGENSLRFQQEGDLRTIDSSGPVLASLGAIPRGLNGPSQPSLPVVRAGEADGASSLDEVIASGHRAAIDVLSQLHGGAAALRRREGA